MWLHFDMLPPNEDVPVRLPAKGSRSSASARRPRSPDELLGERRVILALRSSAALLFAVAFLWPVMTDAMLVTLFAAYAFVDGALVLSPGGWSVPQRAAWPLLAGGCLDLLAAIVVCGWPGITPAILAHVVAIWSVGSALAFTVACVTLRNADTDHLFLAAGIAALIFGRALLSPLAGDVIVLSTWLGLYALTIGILFFKQTLKHYQLLLP
jgi:uncharacterized membrane protein HdeD (DUF308 family)